MKKRVLSGVAILVLIFGILGISSCSNKQVLKIYNWADYIPQEVISQFEKEYNCKVVYDTYASNEEMYAKLKAGAKGYDLVFPSGDHVTMMIKENIIEEIDVSKIPNFNNLKPIVLEKCVFDPEHKYSIPYMIGATGIVVNKKYLNDFEKSWNLYEREELKGKITLLDDMRETIGAALKYLGFSLNTTKPEELQKAKEVLLKWKENILKFDATTYARGIVNGELWAVHGYPENVFLELPEEELENFEFFVPKEGGAYWIDSFVIPKGAKNKDLAYKFIDFILRPEISAQISDYLMIPSPVQGAEDYKEAKTVYELEVLENCEMINYLGKDIDLYNKIWEEVVR